MKAHPTITALLFPPLLLLLSSCCSTRESVEVREEEHTIYPEPILVDSLPAVAVDETTAAIAEAAVLEYEQQQAVLHPEKLPTPGKRTWEARHITPQKDTTDVSFTLTGRRGAFFGFSDRRGPITFKDLDTVKIYTPYEVGFFERLGLWAQGAGILVVLMIVGAVVLVVLGKVKLPFIG